MGTFEFFDFLQRHETALFQTAATSGTLIAVLIFLCWDRNNHRPGRLPTPVLVVVWCAGLALGAALLGLLSLLIGKCLWAISGCLIRWVAK